MSRWLASYAILEKLLGRRLLWRLGRMLYFGARRDLSNDPLTDGEFKLQDWAVSLSRDTNAPVFMDVGANVGVWSSSLMTKLSQEELSARLFAFEPAPSQRAILSEVPVPSMIEFQVFDLALSVSSGISRFEVTGERTGSSSIFTEMNSKKPESNLIDVELSSIDLFIKKHSIDHVNLIKIDTEGNDLNVIMGCHDSLRLKVIDIIQFEYGVHWLNFGHTLRDCMNFSTSLGYKFGKLTSGTVELYSEWHPELERFILANFVLLSPSITSKIPTQEMKFDISNVAVHE